MVTFQTAPSGSAGSSLRGADAEPIGLARSDGHLSVIVEPFDEHGAYIAVDGEIDSCSSQPLRDAIKRVIDANHRHLIIDLSRTTFCDCGTFRALSEASSRSAATTPRPSSSSARTASCNACSTSSTPDDRSRATRIARQPGAH